VTLLSGVDRWLLGRSAIEVASPLSPPDALAALNGLNRSSSNSFAESLQVEVIGAEVEARYRRARSDLDLNTVMNSLRCTFHGHIDAEVDGCRLRGRFALPWLHVAMAFVGLALFVSLLPTTFMQKYDELFWKVAIPVVVYCVVTVPVARADIPFIERNLRYALTGLNDGG
jgi:hypothetical protein